jgi:hypothetical protein
MGKGFTLEVPVNVPANMPWLSRVKMGFHCAQFFMTFMTLCMVGPLISTECKYYVSKEKTGRGSDRVMLTNYNVAVRVVVNLDLTIL